MFNLKIINMKLEEFIKKFNDKFPDKHYDFSKATYTNNKTKILVVCPEHGEFWMRPNDLLNGHGCPKCGKPHSKYTVQDFIEKARRVHGDKYDYSKVEYIDAGTKVKIICPKCGEFLQTAREHLRGHGCPKCKSWKLEDEVKTFLEEHQINYLFQHTFPWLKNKTGVQTLDFYLPDYNVAIECQGKQHFGIGGWVKCESDFDDIYARDQRKKTKCLENNITIFYYSNLHILYPYKVYEDLEILLKDIQNEKLRSNN